MSTHRDERTTFTKQHWQARGWLIVSIALSIDVLARILILEQELWEYLDIAVIWLATILYVAIGMAASGVEPYGGKRSTARRAILVIAVTSAVVVALMGRTPKLEHLLVYIVSAVVAAFVTVAALRGIHGLWERKTLGRGSREE